jgi:hypothetical protein
MKKMKIIYLITGVIFLASCGGSSADKSADTKLEAIETCLCSNVVQGFENGKRNGKYMHKAQLYTGACDTKDQYDTIIERKEFKNGYMISSYKRKKMGNIYVTIDSMTYDNGKAFNGFEIHHQTDYGFTYVSGIDDRKNGVNEWSKIYTSDDGPYVNFSNKDGKDNFDEHIEGTKDEKHIKFKAFLDKVHEINSEFKYY